MATGGSLAIGGKNGKRPRLFISGNELCVLDWDVTETGDEEDTTNTCSGAADEVETINDRLEGTINYQWNVTFNPFDTPFSLIRGSKHKDSKLYIHASDGAGLEDGPFWLINMHILEHSNSAPAKGIVNGSIRFRSYRDVNDGSSYTRPTGADTSGA